MYVRDAHAQICRQPIFYDFQLSRAFLAYFAFTVRTTFKLQDLVACFIVVVASAQRRAEKESNNN